MSRMQTYHQWDATTERLVAFAERARFNALDDATIHETKRRLIDTFASALGAHDEPLSVMARKVASRSRGDVEATLWGSGTRTTPEAAAFANGVMVRLLDVSDTYLGKSRGHPSDMTSGLIALAESVNADGRALVNAVVLAYDVYCSFCQWVDINSRGWDQPVYSVLGCVLGAAKLLELTREQTGNAVSLALAPNMALAQSRRGELSSWKGCAGANASRNAVFAAVLAKEGFTGPPAVFEGAGGMWEAMGRFEWPLPEEGAHMIGETHMKSLPVCYHGQSPVLAAFELRGRITVDEVAEIHIDTYDTAVMMMGSDASRWAPTTHETADHSLPYCVSVALLDGAVSGASFSEARLHDPAIANLMRKVKVREDKALTAQYPEGSPGRVSVRTASGGVETVEIRYPTGHAKSPLTDDEVERKFRDLAGTFLGGARTETALKALWNVERARDIGPDIVRLLAAV